MKVFSKDALISAMSFINSRLDISITLSTKRNLARKCRVFLFQGVKLAYKPWSKKALKERSDSRFLLVKHTHLGSLGRRPGNTTPANTNGRISHYR
jgi:hypothetical protein